MAKEICISSTPHETRLAILEDDQLAEIYYERENEYTLAGSIYNGRVTRVLPGMQSAFVDVGLERDAFLYVTDFMELEDAEETDELEKAASTGANQPPREVRHTAAREPAQERSQDRGGRPSQKPEQKQEPRPARDRQLTVERRCRKLKRLYCLPPVRCLSPNRTRRAKTAKARPAQNAGADADAVAAAVARGSDRRPAGKHEAPAAYVEEITETEPAVAQRFTSLPTGLRNQMGDPATAPASRGDRAPASAPTPFVLPGESLSRYGGAPGERAAETPRPAAPARPESSFKPATLIDKPIQWDGSGLLPGESLSRHRSGRNEDARPSAQAETESQDVQANAPRSRQPRSGCC